MPMNFTPANAAPEKPTGAPTKYIPSRQSVGMNGNTAPVPGAAAEPAPRAPADAGAEAEGEPGQEGAEGEPGHRGPEAWRFAELAKKDRMVRQRMEAAKAAEARAKALEEGLTKREAALKAEEAKRAVWRQNPATLLRDHGYDAQAALQFMLAGEKLTPEQHLAAQVDLRLQEADRRTQEQLEQLRKDQEDADAKRQADLAQQDKQALSEAEHSAVQELQADISEIIAGDSKSFPLVRNAAERGVAAIFDRVNTISDEQFKQTGRRPPITTKMLERAAKEIEDAARKELQESLQDPELAEAMGITARAPARAQTPPTLTNTMRRTAPAQEHAETEAEKRERVKAHIDSILNRRPQR